MNTVADFAIEQAKNAYVTGRLAVDEFERRVAEALAAPDADLPTTRGVQNLRAADAILKDYYVGPIAVR